MLPFIVFVATFVWLMWNAVIGCHTAGVFLVPDACNIYLLPSHEANAKTVLNKSIIKIVYNQIKNFLLQTLFIVKHDLKQKLLFMKL